MASPSTPPVHGKTTWAALVLLLVPKFATKHGILINFARFDPTPSLPSDLPYRIIPLLSMSSGLFSQICPHASRTASHSIPRYSIISSHSFEVRTSCPLCPYSCPLSYPIRSLFPGTPPSTLLYTAPFLPLTPRLSGGQMVVDSGSHSACNTQARSRGNIVGGKTTLGSIETSTFLSKEKGKRKSLV